MSMKRYTHRDGHFKAVVIDSTQIGRDVFIGQMPSPIALQMLVQAMTGALLLTHDLKDEGTQLFKWLGKGPMSHITVEANTVGNVRGFTGQNAIDILPQEGSGLLAQTIGTGQLMVRRRMMPSEKVYDSVVGLHDDEISLSLARFLLDSRQTRAGLKIGVTLDAENGVKAAAGVLIEALPNASEDVLFIMEDRLTTLGHMGDFFAQENGHQAFADELFYGMEVNELSHTETCYRCNCTEERVLKAVHSLQKKELESMRRENKTFDVSCSFCGKVYACTPTHLDSILELKGKKS